MQYERILQPAELTTSSYSNQRVWSQQLKLANMF